MSCFLSRSATVQKYWVAAQSASSVDMDKVLFFFMLIIHNCSKPSWEMCFVQKERFQKYFFYFFISLRGLVKYQELKFMGFR